ncbi:MAG: hypothetical protein QM737_01410 [Ferruginibacter sp.]
MSITITINESTISISDFNLEELLTKVYNKGLTDGANNSDGDNVTFITLSKEMADNGRHISVRTLTARAKEANVKIFRFDGNRYAVKRKDIKHFISGFAD